MMFMYVDRLVCAGWANNRNVTHVSRLRAAQAALDAQLEELAHTHPQRRVALIAFNNDVHIFGDGSLPSPLPSLSPSSLPHHSPSLLTFYFMMP